MSNTKVVDFIKEVVLSNEVPVGLKEDGLKILLSYASKTVQIVPDIYISLPQYYEIEQCLIGQEKISAIKLLRTATGLGLKEAKEAIEELQRDMRTRGELSLK